MWPAKEFPEAGKHVDETSVFELSYPRLIFVMQYQKLSPQLNHTHITHESNKHTVQAFDLFQDSAVHPLLCDSNNNNITCD